jgi:hypothetical protein
MAPESHDHSFFLDAEYRGMGFHRSSHLRVRNVIAFAPLGDRLDVDTKFPTQRRIRSFRSLYESSDGVRGLGALVKNLSHSVSF